MGRSCQRRRRLSHAPGTFRPRLELLEDRVQPGDTILGVSAAALLGLGFPSRDLPLALAPDAFDQDGRQGLFSSLETSASLVPEAPGTDAAYVTIGDRSVTVATGARTNEEFWLPNLLSSDALTGQMAGY